MMSVRLVANGGTQLRAVKQILARVYTLKIWQSTEVVVTA